VTIFSGVSLQKNNDYDMIASMNTIAQLLPVIQLILSLLLILAIILQRAGEGIEGALGGTASNITRFARRGGEKFLFFATIGIAILFVVFSVIGILVV